MRTTKTTSRRLIAFYGTRILLAGHDDDGRRNVSMKGRREGYQRRHHALLHRHAASTAQVNDESAFRAAVRIIVVMIITVQILVVQRNCHEAIALVVVVIE